MSERVEEQQGLLLEIPSIDLVKFEKKLETYYKTIEEGNKIFAEGMEKFARGMETLEKSQKTIEPYLITFIDQYEQKHCWLIQFFVEIFEMIGSLCG